MGIIGTIIIGFVVGLIARFLMPGRDPAGFIATTLLGIIGALLGKYIGQATGLYAPTDNAGFLMAIVGALVVLFIYNLLVRRPETTRV